MRNFRKTSLAGVLFGGLLAMSGFGVAFAGAKFLYTASMNQAVRAFAINPTTGALTAVPGDPAIADYIPLSMSISPDGKFVYTANNESDDISGFAVNATSGALTEVAGSPFAGSWPIRVIVHPNGKFAYANAYSYDIQPYVRNAATGALIAQGNPGQGGIYSTLEIDPSGKFLYAANAGLSILPDPAKTNNISAFTINPSSGALMEISGSPFKTGTRPQRLAVDPSGKYLAVSSTDSHDVRSYAINAATGALTQVGSPISTGGNNYDVRFEPSGHFAYVTVSNLKRILIFSLNAASGTLTKVGTVTTQGNPNYLGVDAGGKFLFLMSTNNAASVVTSYMINVATGALTVSSGPFTVGDNEVVDMVVSGYK